MYHVTVDQAGFVQQSNWVVPSSYMSTDFSLQEAKIKLGIRKYKPVLQEISNFHKYQTKQNTGIPCYTEEK